MTHSQEYENFYRELSLAQGTMKPIDDLPIEEIRLQFEGQMKDYPPASEVRFEPFSMGDLPALWAFAPDVNRRRILLFFFGDSFTRGSIESHKNLIGRLSAATSAAVCAIQYRLAPENPFPSALDDALRAYRWLLHHPYARSRIVFCGISAGAGIVLSLFLRLKQEKIAMPAAGIGLCPWFDLSLQSKLALSGTESPLLPLQFYRWSSEKYAATHDRALPFISPIRGDLKDLPPLFLQTSQSSPLHHETTQLAELAKKNGASVALDIWPDMTHLWQMFAPRFPESGEAIERAGAFVDQVFKEKAEGVGH